MPRVRFNELLEHAGRNRYAVGYFESWNLESLLAVADAAEAKKSPVILGFSGITLPNEKRVVRDSLSTYAAFGKDICARLSVPSCLLFNESAYLSWVLEAIDLEFDAVMFTDDRLTLAEQTENVKTVVQKAHDRGVAVEGELTPLPGAGGEAVLPGEQGPKTGIGEALEFIYKTGVDSFAVDIGQVHRHGRIKLPLDLEHLKLLKERISTPLALHGASSVDGKSIQAAVAAGIAKINVGSNLKRAFFNAMRNACIETGEDFNPYDIIGSGLSVDVLTKGRVAVQSMVEDLMDLFGSTGRAFSSGDGFSEENHRRPAPRP